MKIVEEIDKVLAVIEGVILLYRRLLPASGRFAGYGVRATEAGAKPQENG